MHRHLWAISALALLAAGSGCAVCESYFDDAYPAYGGCCGWHADDHCRAGSAFCQETIPPHAPARPAAPFPPPAAPYDPGPAERPPADAEQPPAAEEAPPPADLTPPPHDVEPAPFH